MLHREQNGQVDSIDQLGPNTEPLCIQNRVKMNRDIKGLQLTANTVVSLKITVHVGLPDRFANSQRLLPNTFKKVQFYHFIWNTKFSCRACALIGILFVLSAFLLAGKSIWALAKAEHTGHVRSFIYLSRLMTKPTKWLCAQRRLRSAWASAQSDQSSLCAHWVVKDPSFLHADSEDSDQTGRISILLVLSWGSYCH